MILNFESFRSIHLKRTGKTRAVKFLVEHGADINQANQFGDTALHLAAERGNEEIVKLLVAEGANMNARDEMGYSPRVVAIRRGIYVFSYFSRDLEKCIFCINTCP